MAADLLTTLVGFNLALAAAIAVAALARRPLRRAFGARIAYAVWLIVPLAGIASLAPARQAQGLIIEPAPLRPIAVAAVERIDALAPSPALMLGAWAAGALLAFLVLAWRQHLSLALLGALTPESRGVVRAASPEVGPAVVGVIRPKIILPADFEARFDDRERAVILAHERAHLAAGDVRVNALVALARCALWFNPMIHLAAHLIRIDQEIACDETVVARHPGDRRAYAQALLKAQVKPAPLPLGCYWPARSRTRLKERLLMLTRKSPSRGRRLTGAAVVGLAALGAGYAAWAAQPATSTAAAAAPQVLVAPIVKLAQNDTAAPDGGLQVHRKVVINRNGETQVYNDGEVPADVQAQIDAALASGAAQKVVKIIHHGDPGSDEALADLPPVGAGAHTLKIQCRRDSGGEPVCTTLEGDPTEAAAAIEKLKSGEAAGGNVFILRREQR